jgi:hypothetical protein
VTDPGGNREEVDIEREREREREKDVDGLSH